MTPVGVIAENVNLVLLDRKIQVFFFLSTSLVSVNSPFYFEDLSQKNLNVSMVVTYVIIFQRVSKESSDVKWVNVCHNAIKRVFS